MQVAAREGIIAHQRGEILQRIQHGAILLQAFVRHKNRLVATSVIHEKLIQARWQAVLRTCDASALRDQRRLRAECSSLRVELAGATEDTERLRLLEVSQARRNDEAQVEASSILEAVQRERATKGASVSALRSLLQQTKAAEAAALERASAVEASLARETMELEGDLHEANARVALQEGGRRSVTWELGCARSELRAAQDSLQEREATLGQQARVLQQQAWQCREQARISEQTGQTQALHYEHEVREWHLAAEQRLEVAEKEAERGLKTRLQVAEARLEHQAAMAEEQDRSIQRLEDLLQEECEQLLYERQNHGRDLDELRSSASLSECRNSLLEEHAAALRRQLREEQVRALLQGTRLGR